MTRRLPDSKAHAASDHRERSLWCRYAERREELGDLKRLDADLREELHLAQDLSCRTIAHDGALIHQHEPRCGERFLRLMLDDDQSDVPLPKRVRNSEDVKLAYRVEVRCRLVQADDLRVPDEDGRDRQSLLLPTGQGRRLALVEPDEVDVAKRLVDAAADLRSFDPEVLGGEGDFKTHIRGEELRLEVLEDQPDPFGELRHRVIGSPLIADEHLSVQPPLDQVWDQTVEKLAEGALARAGRTHDQDELAALDTNTDVIERGY